MLGLVLCGGQSSRMGRDKGLISQEGVSWAAIAKAKLAQLDIEVKLSVNADQFPLYVELFGAENLVVDNRSINVSGPLVALLTITNQHPGTDLFILACDMPDMEVALLSKLLLRFQSFPGSDAYLYKNKEMIEPLCGIYSSDALRSIDAMYNAGGLESFGIRHVLRSLKTDLSIIPPGDEICFSNKNTPDDI